MVKEKATKVEAEGAESTCTDVEAYRASKELAKWSTLLWSSTSLDFKSVGPRSQSTSPISICPSWMT